MSTRSTTHFIYSECTAKPLVAIVYRHPDGYPEGAGKDLIDFLLRCKKLKDTRLEDASYLAARYVVFLGQMYARKYNYDTKRYTKTKDPIDFISCGVLMEDPGDIEYRYVVDCSKILDNGLPEVKCYSVSVNDNGTDDRCDEVPIPHAIYHKKK